MALLRPWRIATFAVVATLLGLVGVAAGTWSFGSPGTGRLVMAINALPPLTALFVGRQAADRYAAASWQSPRSLWRWDLLRFALTVLLSCWVPTVMLLGGTDLSPSQALSYIWFAVLAATLTPLLTSWVWAPLIILGYAWTQLPPSSLPYAVYPPITWWSTLVVVTGGALAFTLATARLRRRA